MIQYTEEEYTQTYNRLAAWLHERDWEGVLKYRAEVDFLQDATALVLRERADAVSQAAKPTPRLCTICGRPKWYEPGQCQGPLDDEALAHLRVVGGKD
jgi:hypothetical protein